MLAILRRVVLALLFLTPAVAPAQQAAGGPRMDASVTAFRRPAQSANDATTLQRSRRSGDNSVPLMLVGGAAIILGSVVGGDAGQVIVIVGVVFLLYGLYKYLQ